jgi:cobalt-zinc-cadmium efflux system membrane fusion protein
MKWIACAMALGWLGCDVSHDESTTPAATLQSPTPINKDEQHGTVDDDSGYIGVLTPREAAEVPAPFASRVMSISVKLGDTVQQGDVLARLDDTPLKEELAIEKATLRSHKAQVARASVEHSAAAARLKREQKGFKENVSSQADVAAAGFDSSKAGTEVARAVADVEEQKARIAALEKKLEDTSLVAPIAGKVALRYVEEGSHVAEGQPIVRVISSDELFVKFAIPATDAKKLAPGDAIDIVFETTNQHATGVVRNVAPELDPVAQMIVAEADLQHAPSDLQSGLVCRITARPKQPAK